MKTKLLFLAAMATFALTSCVNDEFIGDPAASELGASDGSINFGFKFPNATRGDIVGQSAATLLGNNFYVTGTKGTEQSYYPTPSLVFDNYLVHYGVNTAGTTESNTANWEYVGIDQSSATPAERLPENYDRVKLSSTSGAQTIKYWDYSVAQYDFYGFSTGEKKAVLKTNLTGEGANQIASDEIGVTPMLYGEGLDVESAVPTAYTFYIPTISGLQNTYITDITEVTPTNFGKEVTLKFKNLGSKVRVALYETVPGYSVKDVKFYTVEGLATPTDLGTDTEDEAYLIGADNNSFPTKGTVAVRFPHVGNENASKQDYDKADATVTPVTAVYDKFMSFGALTAQLVAKERAEKKESATPGVYVDETENVFLGRDLLHATYAGSAAAQFYQTVFPNTSGYPLTLRVDYTLVPIDGATETIVVKGARAVVPSTYTKWLPNYAYTYIFKISDNTNGWTGPTDKPSGLFPITFDAVVAEATDATGEQRTVTTVATPSITTYQQYHDKTKDEYSKSVKNLKNETRDRDLYVQVMDNSIVPAKMVGTDPSELPLLNTKAPNGGEGTNRALLYVITGSAPISEATVMDALENQSSVAAGVITGRNGMILTPDANINAGVTSIVNGVDDNAITVSAGQAAQIDMSEISAGTYAFVYDYSSAAKTTKTIYQPTGATGTLAEGVKYITKASLDDITYESNKTTEGEAVNTSYLYFSKTTTDGGVTYTYSFYSVDGKTNLPAGLLKVNISDDTYLKTSNGSASATANDFVFATYIRNNGSYAVKVIKVVA